jgi:hypothetical protein
MATNLETTIAAARAGGTVLDDPDDLEDIAIFHWLGHHALSHRRGLNHFVIAAEPLPLRWRARIKKFHTAADAAEFLHPLSVGQVDRQAMRTLSQILGRAQGSPHGDPGRSEILAAAAAALVSGALWALPIKRMPGKTGKADPAVYTSLNGQNGTSVNFAFLAEWEGGQYLRGYVPFGRGGIVAGQSGMTIATGFDIGQITGAELQNYALPPNVTNELKPFVNHKFKDKTKLQVARWVLQTAPVPTITKAEADQIDLAVHGRKLASAINSWDRSPKGAGVPNFTRLPLPWQTVLFSRTFHQGDGMPGTALARPFYTAALAGRWAEAVLALRNYAVAADWYKQRVSKEADYLETDMPAAPVTPPGNRPVR